MKTRNQKVWPEGILSRVSREAYDAVGRARGFGFMTPTEREEAAKSYDKTFKIVHGVRKS